MSVPFHIYRAKVRLHVSSFAPLARWVHVPLELAFCCLVTDRADLCPTAGESVLTGSGPKWQRTRRLLTPSFHFAILKPYVKVFSECTDVLLVSGAASTVDYQPCSTMHCAAYNSSRLECTILRHPMLNASGWVSLALIASTISILYERLCEAAPDGYVLVLV